LRTARIRTTCRSKPQRVRQRPTHRGGALAGRSGKTGSALSQGRQAARGGDSPLGFPLEASEARNATGAKA